MSSQLTLQWHKTFFWVGHSTRRFFCISNIKTFYDREQKTSVDLKVKNFEGLGHLKFDGVATGKSQLVFVLLFVYFYSFALSRLRVKLQVRSTVRQHSNSRNSL